VVFRPITLASIGGGRSEEMRWGGGEVRSLRDRSLVAAWFKGGARVEVSGGAKPTKLKQYN